MFDTILIANRGEIACRVIRTAREMGLRSIAVCSEADADTPHVKMADDYVVIGPAPVADSYLQDARIIEAALEKGAGAIHPGYGFLSENADFASAVENAGLVFIGAPAVAIDAMGNKAGAKDLMLKAGVPCVPGYQGADQTPATFAKEAYRIGYPVMIKAAAGGGGRGMRIVHAADEIKDAVGLAKSEAENAFGSGELILEKAVQNPRHVEVQVFADAHGSVIHLGERDCSVQRRHQKIFEEAPCPVMMPKLRTAMTTAAINAAKAVDYRGAGTVEFLLDSSGEFYFLEMNTRLQVEHPVTEAITGLDLVALQIQVARGEHLPLTQDDVQLNGHAIEARLYAENPSADFMPATGPIALWQPSTVPGIRTDAGIETGGEVSPFYDSMLAKIISHGRTRAEAIQKLKQGLTDTTLLGVASNRSFLIDGLGRAEFASDDVGTGFIAQVYPDGYADPTPGFTDFACAAVILHSLAQQNSFTMASTAASELLGWSSVEPMPNIVTVTYGDDTLDLNVFDHGTHLSVQNNDEACVIKVDHITDSTAQLHINNTKQSLSFARFDNTQFALRVGAQDVTFTVFDPLMSSADAAGDNRVLAPMPGVVISIDVETGAQVEKGQTLAVLEAMKMQHQIAAPRDGVISQIAVSTNDQLTAGALMIELETEE